MDAPVQQQPSAPKKKSNAWIWILVVVVVVLIIFGVIGTVVSGFIAKRIGTKVAETVLSKATNSAVSVNTDSGSLTVKGDDGTTTTFGSTLASGFPTDIPLYTGATVRGSAVGTSASGTTGTYASLTTGDTASKVQAFYDAQLPANGWTKTETGSLGTIIHYLETKGERKLAVTITPYADNQTVISVVESKE